MNGGDLEQWFLLWAETKSEIKTEKKSVKKFLCADIIGWSMFDIADHLFIIQYCFPNK